jgi:enoyl-CoA hydratase
MAEALQVAVDLAGGAQQAIRWTKRTLNHAYRMFEPAFDASLAYEFFGFGGVDAAEGLASLREKRGPTFTGPTE